MIVLQEDESILLKAIEDFDGKKCGETWMIYGPTSYIPPKEVKIIDRRKAVPLSKNEGIYVKSLKTGEV